MKGFNIKQGGKVRGFAETYRKATAIADYLGRIIEIGRKMMDIGKGGQQV